MANAIPNLLLGIIVFVLSLTAMVFAIVMREHGASRQLTSLESTLGAVQTQTAQIQAEIPGTTGSLSTIIAKNNQFNMCITNGNAECSNVTTNYLNAQQQLNVETVQSLNILYITILNGCTSQIDALRMRIAMVNPNPNTTTTVQSGTLTVTVNGTSTGTTYTQYRFTVDDFEMTYIVVDPWGVLIISPTMDPTIEYTNFAPPISTCTNAMLSKSGGRKLFPNVLANIYSDTTLWKSWEQFCDGHIVVYGEGTLGVGGFTQDSGLTVS